MTRTDFHLDSIILHEAIENDLKENNDDVEQKHSLHNIISKFEESLDATWGVMLNYEKLAEKYKESDPNVSLMLEHFADHIRVSVFQEEAKTEKVKKVLEEIKNKKTTEEDDLMDLMDDDF